VIEPVWIFAAARAIGDANEYRAISVFSMKDSNAITGNIAIWSPSEFDCKWIRSWIDAHSPKGGVEEHNDPFTRDTVLLVIDACTWL
jgi:hypothetical protein